MKNIRWFLMVALIMNIGGVSLIAKGTPEKKAMLEEKKVWSISIENFKDSIHDEYVQKLNELLVEKSNGTIELEIYYYGELGAPIECREQLMAGSLEFSLGAIAVMSQFISEVDIFHVPFLFPPSHTGFQKLMDDKEAVYWETLEEEYSRLNGKLLDIWSEGQQVWTSNKFLDSLDDWNNLKIRTMQSPMLVETYRLFGANPTPMPWGELYSSLQLGMLDAQENPITGIWDGNLYEVQSHLTFADPYHLANDLFCNKAFFDSLPEETQELLLEAIAETNDYIYTRLPELEETLLEKIMDKRPEIKVKHLPEEERKPFIEASLPTRKAYIEFAGENGALILEALETVIDQ